MSKMRRDTKGKGTPSWVIIAAVIIIVILLTGGGELSGLLSFGGGGAGLVNVNKQIKFHMVYEYGGSPIASKTDKFNLYASDGANILEANLDTDANGLITTGSDYGSGTTLYLRYEDSNDKQWWKFTVPQMNEKDAESATYNLIRLQGFTIGTYTTDTLSYQNGTSITDGDSCNTTANSIDTQTFKYSLRNTGNDNTGVKTSYDPEYQQNWDVVFYMTLSGTGYERVLVYDTDWSFTLGTTHYEGENLNAYALTKHKVGMEYKSLGAEDVVFWVDVSAITSGDSVVMQIYVYAYADHVYAENHGGSFGPEAVQLAEHTLTFTY